MLLKLKDKTLEAWSLYQPYQVTNYSTDFNTNLDLYTALLNFYVQVTSFSIRKKKLLKYLIPCCLFFPPELITSHTHTHTQKKHTQQLHSQRSSLSLPSQTAPCKARPSYPFESRHHHRSGRSNLGVFWTGKIPRSPRAQPWPLFLKVNPSKQGDFFLPSKTSMSCWTNQVDEVKLHVNKAACGNNTLLSIAS